MSYILALDQGTTSSRSIIFDHSSNVVSLSQREFTQIFPKSGWVEHDAAEIWESQKQTAIDALNDVNADKTDIAAIGITNQRETTVIWDRQTGKPICNAIVWQDRRTSELCNSLKAAHGPMVSSKTGLPIDAYFSASKIKWMLDNVANARTRADAGELCFGTIDTWLVWNFTGGCEHVTDVSNASRTMLFNIHDLKWDDELLELFDVPEEILPEVRSSSEVYGHVREPVELEGLRIAGIAGDQQAALFGQLCVEIGAAKSTYGTGCFLLQNTGAEPVKSKNHLLTTIAWQIGESVEYALEGSVFIGGAVVQWLRDALEIVSDSNEVERLSESVPDNGGVYFVPAFAGLGTPYWDQNARGIIVGLTRGTGKAHIARAAIESIAFQTADLLDAMQKDSGIRLSELRVDGGATKNNSLMQFQANMLGIPVVRSKVTETTALGAAYLAGLAVDFWKDFSDLSEHWQKDRQFEPRMDLAAANSMRKRWDKAVTRALDWE